MGFYIKKDMPPHQMTLNLKQLSRPLIQSDEMRIALAVSGDTVGKEGHIYGFGIAFASKHEDKIDSIAAHSDTRATSDYRGYLAAALTILEWLSINAPDDISAVITTSYDPLYKHIRTQIAKWLADSGNPNRDLLGKIAPLLKRFPNVAFNRPTAEDEDLVALAKSFAEDGRYDLPGAYNPSEPREPNPWLA